MGVEQIEAVRRTSDLTMDCVTARVDWSATNSWRAWTMSARVAHSNHRSTPVGRIARGAWLGAGSVSRAVDRGYSRLMSAEGRGLIDFGTGGCLLSGRKLGLALELYFRPGSSALRRQRGGRWHEEREQSAQGSAVYTPVWLVELPRGVTEVTGSKDEMVHGTSCRHLTGAL
jgi:hypothetical protein